METCFTRCGCRGGRNAAVRILYAAVFVALGLGVLFGFKVAWVKRKFLMGLIPNEEVTPAVSRLTVERATDAVRIESNPKAEDTRKSFRPTNQNDNHLET